MFISESLNSSELFFFFFFFFVYFFGGGQERHGGRFVDPLSELQCHGAASFMELRDGLDGLVLISDHVYHAAWRLCRFVGQRDGDLKLKANGLVLASTLCERDRIGPSTPTAILSSCLVSDGTTK